MMISDIFWSIKFCINYSTCVCCPSNWYNGKQRVLNTVAQRFKIILGNALLCLLKTKCFSTTFQFSATFLQDVACHLLRNSAEIPLFKVFGWHNVAVSSCEEKRRHGGGEIMQSSHTDPEFGQPAALHWHWAIELSTNIREVAQCPE